MRQWFRWREPSAVHSRKKHKYGVKLLKSIIGQSELNKWVLQNEWFWNFVMGYTYNQG